MATAVLAAANVTISNPFVTPSHQHITVTTTPSPPRPQAPSASSIMPSQRELPPTPSRTFHRIRSTLEESLRAARRPSKPKAAAEDQRAISPTKLRKGKPPAPSDDLANEKDSSLLFKTEVTFGRTTVSPPASPGSPPPVTKTKAGEKKKKEPEERRETGFRSFLPPSLRQASMSSPALHLAPSPKSRSAIPASSSSTSSALVSPPRQRRASVQPASREIGSPTPLAPRRSSRVSSEVPRSRPIPLTSPSTPALSSTLRGTPPAPESPTRRTQAQPNPPDSPTPMAHSSRKQLSNILTPSSSGHLPIGNSPPSPSPIRARFPSQTRIVVPTSPRALASASTTNLPMGRLSRSPSARTSSGEHGRSSEATSPPRVSLSPIRPRATSTRPGNYTNNRQLNASTVSLSQVSTSEQRELLWNAASLLCRELAKQPSHIPRTAAGTREWEEVAWRMRPLMRSQRMWGKSGGMAGASSSQVNMTNGLNSSGFSSSGDERERRLFCEALRDGFVLCQFINKVRSAPVTRPDPREDGFVKTSNVTTFIAACSLYGLRSDDIFLGDDLIETSTESLARVATTILALVRLRDGGVPDQSKYIRGQGKRGNGSGDAGIAIGPYQGTSRASASTPNLLTEQLQRSASPTSPTSPVWKGGSPASESPRVGSNGSSSSDRTTRGDDRGHSVPGNRGGINGVPLIYAPPPKNPLRRLSPTRREDTDVIGPLLTSPNTGGPTPIELVTGADPARPSIGDSTHAPLADPRKAARHSVASSAMTDTTTFSSMFDAGRSSGSAANKFGTIRTVTTEQTDPPSLTRTEGSAAAALVLEERGRKRSLDLYSRERKPSEPAIVDLSRVAEETEEAMAGSTKRGLARRLPGTTDEQSQERERVDKVRLGKGKWPDDFIDAFKSRPIPINPAPAITGEGYSASPISVTPPSISGPRKLAVVGRRNESSESLLPRRPTHRARHSIDTAPSFGPKESLLRDSSPDGIPSSARVMLRRNSTKPSPHRTGGLTSGSFEETQSKDGEGGEILIPFPLSTSADQGAHSSSPAPGLDRAHRSDSPLLIDRPRLRGRFQSEIAEGTSSRRRGRPNSYDELGSKPARRSRYESMVNLGGTSGHASASDLITRDSLGGSHVRRTLIIREEGKPPTHFQLGNCIGRGQFGSVYRALNLNTGQMVAVKRISLDGLKEDEVTQLMREVELVRSLSHPGIVKYEGMARDMDSLSIVLEYAENGSLGQTLKAFGKLNERLIAGYVVKILEGLHYLHQCEVVHCDLKAANILTTKTGNVKLSDFGVSLNLRAMQQGKQDVAGTPNWMAPEVIKLEGASPKSDIWSLACTVIELLTGRPPYADIANSMSVMFRIVEDQMPPLPEGCSELLQDFLVRCFDKDPTKRPSAEMLCEHPWLKKNWGAHKELRPQDSIPFLRRVSADLQKSEAIHYLSQIKMPELPNAEDLSRGDVSGSPPKGPHPVNGFGSLPNDTVGPREHSFVKTTFSKAMVCRVCLLNVKKSAVLCAQCSLIAHTKCTKNAPPTCDLRSQLLLYARYAESGNPASAYQNPLDVLDEAQTARLPVSAMSDVVYVSHTPRTSIDTPRPLPQPASTHPPPPPPEPKSTSNQVVAALKFFTGFKRTRATSPEPTQPPVTPIPQPPASTLTAVPSRPLPKLPHDSSEERPPRKPGMPRQTRDRPTSLASDRTAPNSSSLRSAAAAAEGSSRGHVPGRSVAWSHRSRGSTSRFSLIADSEGHRSSKATIVSEMSVDPEDDEDSMPGDFPMSTNAQPKKRDSRTPGKGCTLQ